MMSTNSRIATIGLGLMGSSIATCLLASGHTVTSLVRDIGKAGEAKERIRQFLKQLRDEQILKLDPELVLGRLKITNDISHLAGEEIVIESITENLEEKKAVFQKLETVVSPTAIIGSNPSA